VTERRTDSRSHARPLNRVHGGADDRGGGPVSRACARAAIRLRAGGRVPPVWLVWCLAVGLLCLPQGARAADPGAASDVAGNTVPRVEILHHEWRPDQVWERIGKTKFVWSATVRNNSDTRLRVYVYYDLLDERGVPLARNVFNRYVPPHQTVKIAADSYIETVDLPKVRSSRATAKVGYPE